MYGWRKIGVLLGLLVLATVLLILKLIDGTTWANIVTWLGGLYFAANAAVKFSKAQPEVVYEAVEATPAVGFNNGKENEKYTRED